MTWRIRALENELSVALFNRTGRGVSLTPAGERLLPFAIRVARLIEEAASTISDDGQPKGSLVIGSLETTAALRLTPVLSQFVADYPEVNLSLQDRHEPRAGGRRSGAPGGRRLRLRSRPPSRPAAAQKYRERLVVLTSRREPSLGAYLRRNDLRMVVLRAGCSYRLMLEAWLAHRGIVGVRMLEFGTLEAIIGCVEAGLGMTLLPEALVWTGLARRADRRPPLPNDYGEVDTLFIRRRDGFQLSALGAFLALAGPQFAPRPAIRPRTERARRDVARSPTA